MIVQVAPHVFVGLQAELPVASGYRSGDSFYASDTKAFYVLTIVAGVKTWSQTNSTAGFIRADGTVPFAANESMGGFLLRNLGTPLVSSDADTVGARNTAILNQLSKYWVAPPGTFPQAPYNTIQSAIDAAISDGHSAASPAAVIVLPGGYAETPTLKDGIFVYGIADGVDMDIEFPGPGTTYASAVVCIGFKLDPGFTFGGIRGVFMVGSGLSTTFAIDGSANAYLISVIECQIRGFGAGSVAIGGAPAGNPSLTFSRCKILNVTTQGGAIGAGLNINGACDINLLNTSVQCNVGTDLALRFGAGAIFSWRTGNMFGGLALAAGNSTLLMEDVDERLSGATPYIAQTAGAPTVTWIRGNLSGSTSAPNLTGTFTFTRQGEIATDANGLQPASTVTWGINRSQNALTVRDNGAADLTAASFLLADIHKINTHLAAHNANIPAAQTYPPGVPTWIVADQTGGAAANAITLVPNGTDLLNGVNANIVLSADLKGGACLVRDPTVTVAPFNWLVMGIH